MRKCKVCRKELLGRKDKVFCSAACKNYYHVGLRRATKKTVEKYDAILHRNRSILLEFLGKNGMQKKVKRIELAAKKFSFKYHTHFHINKQGKMYLHVYDFAWMEFSDDEILIVKRRE
jgi:hypothetical protein